MAPNPHRHVIFVGKPAHPKPTRADIRTLFSAVRTVRSIQTGRWTYLRATAADWLIEMEGHEARAAIAGLTERRQGPCAESDEERPREQRASWRFRR